MMTKVKCDWKSCKFNNKGICKNDDVVLKGESAFTDTGDFIDALICKSYIAKN